MNYTIEHERLWNVVMDSFQTSLPSASFTTWFKPLKLYAVSDNEVMVTIEDDNPQPIQNMIKNRYFSTIESKIRQNNSFGMKYSLRILSKDEIEKQKTLIEETMLNPKYTFESFIVGESNRFAYAASLAVAEQSQQYNPLFIHGDVGLGKTHLMNAIGNYVIAQNQMARIMLTTSERFVNELYYKLSKKQDMSKLREKLRNVDILMVDDIQFLGKTDFGQEEFFHTFNDLFAAGKQIILSADRPPNEIPTIEERLRSRFGSGLIVDIKKPDFATRVAILMRKAGDESVTIPADVAEYIAAHFDKSVRDLEGALTRLIAESRLMGVPLSMDLAVKALGDLAQTPDTRIITSDIIIDAVSRKTGVSAEDLVSKKRSKDIASARHIAIYLCRTLTEDSTTKIGQAFGGRDHTTVMHSCEKIAEDIKNDPSLNKKINELINAIKAN